MGQKTHVMHGRDHCPTGADPIPCLPPGSPTAAGYADAVVAIPDLVGYWRLGEADEPYLDTSGYAPGDEANAAIDAGAQPMTTDVTPGALTDGDDGAVGFTRTMSSESLSAGGDILDPGRFNLISEQTICAWVRPVASASSFVGGIVTCWDVGSAWGWGVFCEWPARQLQYRRRHGVSGATVTLTGPSLPTDEWVFVAASYDAADGHRLYVDATQVDSDAATATTQGGNIGIYLGRAGNPTAGWTFNGDLDEAAVWERALTPTEIATLYAAGIDEHTAAGGSVLVSDGEGGSMWGQVTTPAIADEAVTPAKLEPGTDGHMLKTVAGTVVWALPTVRVNY
jgi:concanavalin A-like lectin/glucanase superfamily protein